MILFLGIRPGKSKASKMPDITCNHCSQTGTITGFSHPNYFHLFWIPLFTVNTSQFAECSHCKRVYYKEDFSSEMTQAFNQI